MGSVAAVALRDFERKCLTRQGKISQSASLFTNINTENHASSLGKLMRTWMNGWRITNASAFIAGGMTLALANAIFFLSETAAIWYENREDFFTSWDGFVEEVKRCFSDSTTKKKRVEEVLAQRAQAPGKTCVWHMEDVLKLCRQMNPRMSEEDKVGHLKGITEDVYGFLIVKENLSRTADVLRHCQTFEIFKTRRITVKFGRLENETNVSTLDTAPMLDTLPFMIRGSFVKSLREQRRQHQVKHMLMSVPYTITQIITRVREKTTVHLWSN